MLILEILHPKGPKTKLRARAMESGVRVIDQEDDKRAQGSMTESQGAYMHAWACPRILGYSS
jgi:hypothetical protein